MRRENLLTRREMIAITLGTLAGGCRTTPSVDAAMERAGEEARKQMEAGIFTGAALARSDRGRALYMGWQGKGPETGAVDERTRFDAASLTKTVTAAVLARLVEKGKLDPDAPFVTYLPDHAVGKDSPITIRQIATHSAGFGHAIAPAKPADPTRCLSDTPYVERLLAQKPFREPGKCLYSCYNFQLLALVAERVGEAPLDQLAKKLLFKPLGMKRSAWWPVPDDGHVMHPEVMPPENFVVRKIGCVSDPPAYHAGRPVGNAGLFTTLPDLRRFTADLLRREHFSSVYYDLLFTCTFDHDGYRRSFGFDMGTGGRPDGLSEQTIHHSGYTGQMLCVDPVTDFAAVLLTVRSGSTGDSFRGRKRILSLLAGGGQS